MSTLIKCHFHIALSLIISVCVITSCSNDDNTSVPVDDNPDNIRKEIILSRAEQELVNQCNDFAFRLLQTADKNLDKKQIVLSPLSASFALSMAANGAAGLTQQEILNTLGFAGFSLDEMNGYNQKLLKELGNLDKTSTVNMANSVWLHKGFNVLSSYKKTMDGYYEAEVKTADFSSDKTLKQINEWCSDKTDGHISNFLEELSSDARFVLLNALCFNGEWAIPFSVSNTKQDEFQTTTGAQSVDFMLKMDLVPYMEYDRYSLVKLSYGNGAFSMYIVLPNEGVELSDCLSDLNAKSWNTILDEMLTTRLNIKLPKFKIEYRENLIPLLKSMGITEAFEMYDADFSNLSKEDLFIGKVEQANYLNVMEDGTEAATVTDMEGWLTRPSPGNTVEAGDFHVNRPFLFILSEKSTGSILYIGKVEKI